MPPFAGLDGAIFSRTTPSLSSLQQHRKSGSYGVIYLCGHHSCGGRPPGAIGLAGLVAGRGKLALDTTAQVNSSGSRRPAFRALVSRTACFYFALIGGGWVHPHEDEQGGCYRSSGALCVCGVSFFVVCLLFVLVLAGWLSLLLPLAAAAGALWCQSSRPCPRYARVGERVGEGRGRGR